MKNNILEKKKVLHIAHYHPKDDSRIVMKELCSLYDLGYDVYYITKDSNTGKTPENIKFSPVYSNNKTILVNYFINKDLDKEYFELISKIKPDIIHIHEYIFEQNCGCTKDFVFVCNNTHKLIIK